MKISKYEGKQLLHKIAGIGCNALLALLLQSGEERHSLLLSEIDEGCRCCHSIQSGMAEALCSS